MSTALFLHDYLTEYDADLLGESYIDPAGTLVIWSAFGRQVFQGRINSISNDVRNYTLNLFHHFLIRKLMHDSGVTLSTSLQKRYAGKDSLHFKQACLLFLENLFVYSLLRHKDTDGVQSEGIIGISKARRSWDKADANPEIFFTHEPKGQLLVRQLSLGVGGRYKQPLIGMMFFDNNYQYDNPASQLRWESAEALVTTPSPGLLRKLQHLAYDYLKKHVQTTSFAGGIKFADVGQPLTRAYVRAFASPSAVGRYARHFWLHATGLDAGSAGALLQELEDGGEDLPAQQVLARALQRSIPPAERIKLEQIATVEPFLSDCMLLFTLMAAARTQSLTDIASHWGQSGRNAERLPDLAARLRDYPNLAAVRGNLAGQRLSQLLSVASAGGLEQQIRALADYHAAVMRARGQAPWLTVDEDGAIKVQARLLRPPELPDCQPGSWSNTYYLPQFKNFVAGMRGGI